MTRIQAFIAFIAIAVLMGVVGHMDYEEADRQHEEYCEMVKLYKQSNGEKGWPAYNGEKGCK